MRLVIAAICFASAAQKKQQERMKACNDEAGDKKGDDRKSS